MAALPNSRGHATWGRYLGGLDDARVTNAAATRWVAPLLRFRSRAEVADTDQTGTPCANACPGHAGAPDNRFTRWTARA